MSNLLQVQNAYKSFGARTLLAGCTLAINESEHVGVIGPNGAGKSTLFKIIVGLEDLDSGQITRAQNLRLGYLSQEENWQGCLSGAEYLERHCKLPIWDLFRTAHDLGLSQQQLEGPITALSGGYRMRIKLVHLIGNEPNLMLLDEPTNYLDLETLLVLERFLQDYQGAFLLISHDREFLRRVTDHTLEVEQGDVTKFNGHIDDYFEQKQMLQEQLQARADSLSNKRSEILDFVARYGAKASKAKQAQSRLKRLERMESIEVKALPTAAHIVLPPPVRTGQLITRIENAELGYPGNTVLAPVNLQLNRGDHAGVVGVNGAGKSTLLKTLAGDLDILSGACVHNTEIGYFAQHVSERLHPGQTVFQALGEYAHPDVTRQEILNLAGSLLFSGDDVEKKISVLSGGEKSRVALGQILLKKAPCLLLDEPTNHLDFNTVEALTQALQDYEGTVVIVSHDRSFVRRVATRIIEIRNGKVDFYPGTYDEYVWSLQKGALSETLIDVDAPVSVARPAPALAQPANYKEQRKALDRKLKQLEKEIALLEKEVNKLENSMLETNDALLKSSGEEAGSLGRELSRLQNVLSETEARWLELLEQKEQAERELSELIAQ